MARTTLQIQLADTATPVVLLAATLRGAGGWALEVTDGISRRAFDIEEENLARAVVVDPETGATRPLTVLDLAEMPNSADPSESQFGTPNNDRTAAPTLEGTELPEPSGVLAPAPTVKPSEPRGRAKKTLAVVLGLVVLLLAASGGFAAGWFVHSAQDDDADASATELTTPLADQFDANPGALAGREIPGRTGAVWADRSDAFVVEAGGAQGTPESDTPAVAILEQTESITSVSATYSTVAAEAGLVFRFQDEENYWKIVAAPDYGTWAISRVEDGETKTIGDTGFVGGSTVEVIFVGSTIQFWIDGVLRESVRDEFLADANLIGLVVGPGGRDAVCDEFRANTV